MRTLWFSALVAVVLSGCSGEDPDGNGPPHPTPSPALSSEDPAVAGPAILDEMTRAIDEGDVEAIFDLARRKDLEGTLEGAQRDLDRIRDKPRQLAAAQDALKLEKSPLDLSRREWAMALLRTHLTRGRDAVRAKFGTKFISAHLDQDRLILVAEGSADGADGKPAPYQREHVFVREDGTWRRDEEASWEYATRLHSVLHVVPERVRKADGDANEEAVTPPAEPVEASEPLRLVDTLVFTPDGRHLLSADPQGVIVWDWEKGTKLREIRVHEVTKMAVHPDGRWLATGGLDVSLWEVSSGRKYKTLVPEFHPEGAMAVSPDGRHVATAQGGTIHLWDPDTGKGDAMVDEAATVMKLAFLGTEHLISVVAGKLRVHDLAGKQILVIPHAKRDLSTAALTVSPEGDRIGLHVEEHKVEVFDARTGRRVAAIEDEDVRALRFSPSGRVLAVGGNEIRRWDVKTRRLIHIHNCLRPGSTIGYTVNVGSEGPLAYHPSGKILATAFATESGPTIMLFETAD